MSISPNHLERGNKIAIVCPASRIQNNLVKAIKIFESWKLKVVFGNSVNASYNQFGGTDFLRAEDVQRFLDDNSITAIIAARGGYGSIRIIDHLDFSNFSKNPKWIVGFSDITVFHSHIYSNFGIQTIHGHMPSTISSGGTKLSVESLRKALFGERLEYRFKGSSFNKRGQCDGIIIGGNLTILATITNSSSEMDFTNKILFLEDVDEYFHSIDRMLCLLKRANKLSCLNGLIIGGFSDLKDFKIPFGLTIEQMILGYTEEYNYPICFDFPAGHVRDNHALILGAYIHLDVGQEAIKIRYIENKN